MEHLAERLRSTLPPLPAIPAPPGPAATPPAGARSALALWAGIIAGIESARAVALADPGWPEAWRLRMAGLADRADGAGRFQLLVPTGGSSGLPRYCVHDAGTLGCAAQGFAGRFGAAGILHAVNVLPQHHVGGLMPVFRAAACAGKVHFADYRDAPAIASAPFPLAQASISLVPTQLRRMLADAGLRAILSRFGLILIGGAGCPPDLLAAARQAGLRLAPCYGSTETAAMVTALDPDQFLAGSDSVGTALPHARIELDHDQRILIDSGSNLRARLPADPDFCRQPLRTGDVGELDARGHLHIRGRADRIIITGGEKVHPEQVEAAALATGLLADARCEGVTDPDWGARIVLHAVPAGPSTGPADLLARLRETLPPYAIPKEIRLHAALPRSELGKWRGTA